MEFNSGFKRLNDFNMFIPLLGQTVADELAFITVAV